MTDQILDAFIKNAINEDIGDGDHSSLSCIPASAIGKAQLLVKQDGVLAGIEIAKKIFTVIDPELRIEQFLFDGNDIHRGDRAFIVEGKIHSILQAERLVLNIMQRMSGIATTTKTYVDKLIGTKARVLDTRKTTPGLRFLEKLAVKIGGGENHRMGLYDMIMLKDNHIDFAGGIEPAIRKAREYLKKNDKDIKIEIEARNLNEVKEILKVGGVDRIMLDNFNYDDTREAVNLIDEKYEIESSGGITLETIRNYAICGVDFISVGALTHQIKSLDMSLKAI
ncbi:MAG TPA: carboxylating nicotinate-nucleotide diphosphorylase [Bacteroidales bacterium]|jgi:nicotinate-nucleotide pyrophosphorylase (carboxylating)|nr:carboxylating nicotinate-nucleotide diphosphorylase [Bacteroidales bacterium]